MAPPAAHPASLDCRDVVRSTFDTMERVYGDAVELVLRLPTTPAPIAAAPEDLIDILVSLLNLSRDCLAANDAARVVATVRDSAPFQLEIGDNGPGFGRDELAAAFVGGAGTSDAAARLADCSRRIARLGGQFQVESRVGEGTRYEVSLPSVTGA